VQLPVSATLRGTEHTLNPLCFSHHVPTSPGDFESRDWVHGGFVDQVINAREILARRRVPEGDRATCSAALSRAVRRTPLPRTRPSLRHVPGCVVHCPHPR
jgi:hypothetical protein